MIDLFHESQNFNFASYSGGTTPYSYATDIPSTTLKLLASASKPFCFKNNHLKANPTKSHTLLSTKKP